jgi:hypothetical protein
MKKLVFTLAIGFLLSLPGHAALSPVGIAILPPVQFPPEDFSVTGVRASLLWGHHRDVYGVDLGLIGNITEQDSVGFALAGGFNWTKGTTTSIVQAAGVANINENKTNVVGLQAALGINANYATSSVTGLQIALVNMATHTTINGVQAGVFNKALRVNGFQIGLVNVTDSLRGLQIGLINFHNKGLFVVSPIINFGF